MNTLIKYFFFSIAIINGLILSPVNADDLQQKIIAVHATDYFPVGGILKAGLGDTEGFENKIEAPILEMLTQSRATVHFSLGELVRPVGDWKSWERTKFAVVVKLQDLMPQLINLNCYDTFILGDFKLTETTILVAPAGEIQSNNTDYILYEYDPSETTLRKAVDHAIQLLGGWPIRMLEDDEEDILREAIYDSKNINSRSFFTPLLDQRPYLSVGLRFNKADGEHYRLSKIESGMISFINYFFHIYEGRDVVLPSDELLKSMEKLNKNFTAWENYLEGFKMGPESTEAFHRLKKHLNVMTNLIHLEAYLNEKYSRTLKGLDKTIQLELIKRWTNLDELKSYFDQNLEGSN